MLALTDDILWDSFRQGNKNALANLFDRHYASLYRYASKIHPDRELINDHIQDLFLEIWHQRSPKPVLSIKGYLLQALRYKVLRSLQQKTSYDSLTDDNQPFVVSPEDFLIQQEGDAQWNRELTTALEQLSPRQREVIYLRYYLSLSYREICGILTLDYQLARNHLYAGIKRLRSILELKQPSNWFD